MGEERSELVKWSSTFSVGIQIIDEQHKGLLDLVNDMFYHVSGDEDSERQYFSSVVQQAVTYIKVHFNTEEQLMTGANYPGYAEHKKAHEDFIRTVVNQVKSFDAGKRFALLEFTKYLKEWILTHIGIVDKHDFTQIKKNTG